jgi:replicative DNA helicase
MSNEASEKLLLSGMVRHPAQFFEFCQYLDEQHFSSEGAQLTWLALQHLLLNNNAESVSKAKLVSAAKSLGHINYLAKVRNGDWLDELFKENVTPSELVDHFMEVKRQALMSDYIQATEDVRQYLRATSDPLSQVISKVEDMVVNRVTMLDRGEHSIKFLLKDSRSKVESIANDPGHLGVDLGYALLQSRVGQFRNGSVTLFVGTTKSGKSQFGMRAGLQAAHKLNIPVLVLDSELNIQDQMVRAVAQLAEVPYDIIETGYWKLTNDELRKEGVTNQDDLDRIALYRNRMRDDHFWQIAENLPIEYVSISGMSVAEVIPHIRRWLLTRVKPDRNSKVPQCLIIYDYIKLANAEEIRGGVAEWQAHGLNVAALHDLATRYNIPLIAFGQTNQQIDSGIGCVAGGKRISENVTSVVYFKRKTDEERSMDGNGTHLVRVFASRYGRGTLNGYINYNVDLSCGKFLELGMGTVDFDEERSRRDEEKRKERYKKKDDDE